jgi:hypothetical protein
MTEGYFTGVRDSLISWLGKDFFDDMKQRTILRSKQLIRGLHKDETGKRVESATTFTSEQSRYEINTVRLANRLMVTQDNYFCGRHCQHDKVVIDYRHDYEGFTRQQIFNCHMLRELGNYNGSTCDITLGLWNPDFKDKKYVKFRDALTWLYELPIFDVMFHESVVEYTEGLLSNRDFGNLPILADLIEECGHHNDYLTHLLKFFRWEHFPKFAEINQNWATSLRNLPYSTRVEYVQVVLVGRSYNRQEPIPMEPEPDNQVYRGSGDDRDDEGYYTLNDVNEW